MEWNTKITSFRFRRSKYVFVSRHNDRLSPVDYFVLTNRFRSTNRNITLRFFANFSIATCTHEVGILFLCRLSTKRRIFFTNEGFSEKFGFTSHQFVRTSVYYETNGFLFFISKTSSLRNQLFRLQYACLDLMIV